MPLFRGGWLFIVGAFALWPAMIAGLSLPLLFATGALMAGGVLLTNGIGLRMRLAIAQGVLSMLVGVLALVIPATQWPLLATVIGVWAVLMGTADLLVVRRHHSLRGRNMLAIAGVVTLVGGVLAFFVPELLGAQALFLFGALGIVAGAALIAYGMRRRRRYGHVSASTSAHRDEERRVEEHGAAAHT